MSNKKLALPKGRGVKRQLSRIAAHRIRSVINGGQPISGLLTLTGKAERLERGHKFRLRIARLLRFNRKQFAIRWKR